MAKTATSNGRQRRVLPWIWVVLTACFAHPTAHSAPTKAQRVFEATFESKKRYADPFNDVDVDVVFTDGRQSWRVPTFWRGESKWTVRFAPPVPGVYRYRLQSSDRNNPDLNDHAGRVLISAYDGANALLRHGALRVSQNGRYFEHTDGTPFYWLGETLFTTISDRISWEGFQKLILDRKAKGFTVAQVNLGLTVSNEEVAPVDAGFRNEGGPVWDAEFRQINPLYFDYADRRIQFLVDSEITPAITGAWGREIERMGVAKMQKHWRYLIARYGAYPVIWVLGGEVSDPPVDRLAQGRRPPPVTGQWTQVARYVRAHDPYMHLLTAHEQSMPNDVALQDESLTDFDLMQPSHFGWPAIAAQIAQLNTRWSSRSIRKPLVIGEIGLEGIGGTHLQDFQRTAFWTAMLNGAAGYSYGTAETAMATSADKPLHRSRYSFYTWEEAMHFPGSYQTGLNANLLKNYPWWQMEPHPEWVTPRGTTLLEPHEGRHDVDLGQPDAILSEESNTLVPLAGWDFPKGEWKRRGGNYLMPYAAGIPRQLRFIYIPYYGLLNFIVTTPPTVLGLEDGVRYHAYYWEPSLGIKFDLGAVEKPASGALIHQDRFSGDSKAAWTTQGIGNVQFDGHLNISGQTAVLLSAVKATDCVVAVDIRTEADAALLLRYQDADNYLAAAYSSEEGAVYLAERTKGKDQAPRSRTPVEAKGPVIRLMAEARGNAAAAAAFDGDRTYSTAIETVSAPTAGAVGLMHQGLQATQRFANFELRQSPTVVQDAHLEKKLYDARGIFRGELVGPAYPFPSGWEPPSGWELPSGWDDFGKRKRILLGAYRPDRPPASGDWVLVLENRSALSNRPPGQ